MRQIRSTILALAAGLALLATPAFAQSPAPAAPKAAPAKAAPAKKMAPKMKMAAKPRHKFSCYDYAWQSQDMKNCLAKASAKPAAAKKHIKAKKPIKKSS